MVSLVVAWLVPREAAAVSAQVLCTPHHTTMHQFTVSLHSHIGRVLVCLAVTCHLHFWQNGRDLLRVTAVTLGWNGYRNKSQHRKLTPEKKFSSRSCGDSNPGPLDHESSALTSELSPLPIYLPSNAHAQRCRLLMAMTLASQANGDSSVMVTFSKK